MRWSDVISFVNIVKGTDAHGFPADVEVVGDEVFCNEKDVRSSEFYQASMAGFLLEKTFIVRTDEYDKQKYLRHGSQMFEVVRTYEKGDNTELVCQLRSESH